MKELSRRDFCKGALAIGTTGLLSTICPKSAEAETIYGPNAYSSGFGYSFSATSIVNHTSEAVWGGLRLQASPEIYWDAPLLSCDLYVLRVNISYEKVQYRPLQPAIGSGTTWACETGLEYRYLDLPAKSNGRIVCYNPTYITKVDFYSYYAEWPRGVRTIPEDITTSIFKKNEMGMTYGSSVNSHETGLYPTLVASIGINGVSGYIYQSDFDELDGYGIRGEMIPPEKELLTVYAEDGVTPVDLFKITL